MWKKEENSTKWKKKNGKDEFKREREDDYDTTMPHHVSFDLGAQG